MGEKEREKQERGINEIEMGEEAGGCEDGFERLRRGKEKRRIRTEGNLNPLDAFLASATQHSRSCRVIAPTNMLILTNFARMCRRHVVRSSELNVD